MKSSLELSERLAALSPAQRGLLELRLKRQASKDPELTIPKRSQENYCPLSLDQERLWFIHQLDPDTPAYNIYSAIRFKGRIKIDVLLRSLNEIVRRHEILRTRFATVDGKPIQVIEPHYEADIPLVDLAHIAPTEREAEAERLVADAFQQPFDLRQLPLFRTTLIKLSDEDYVCPTVFHHIITDWVSTHGFDREMAALYEAFSNGAPSPLPELAIQYADFAVWQRERLSGQVTEDHLAYWREQLKGAPHVLDLPTDRPRPRVQTFHGFRQPVVLSKTHSDLARIIAREEGVTPFIFFLAVFKLLLFRYTEQEKIIVGSPVANRNLSELQDQLGFFINQLVFCTDLSGNPTFRELLRRVREVALGAYAHQEIPFGMLVDELQPERDLSRTPLTQVVLLVLKNEREGAIKFSGLQLAPFVVDGQSSKFDMTLSLWDSDDGFRGWVEYNTELFDKSTIIRITDHLRTLLGSIVENPEQPISDLPMLTTSEQHQIRVEWNDTSADFALERCIHELFEMQAARTPDSPALISGTQTIKYEELNERANQLAHHLMSLGMRPDALVGILLERSPEAIVAMLAVLKAGGAFVPLDIDHPIERLEFMAQDAELAVIVTRSELVGKLPRSDAAVICLDTEAGTITVRDKTNPPGVTNPDNLAYVIYTSGSTGKPKGVMVEHRNLVNTLSATQHKFNFSSDDRFACLAPMAFDISIFEWLCPLLVGGSCLMLSSDELFDPGRIARMLDEVTVFHAVPGLMKQITDSVIEETSANRYSHLRRVFSGGEAVSPEIVSRLNQVFPSAEICVLYGPTEATIMCSSFKASQESKVNYQMLGRPLPNMKLLVCDRQQNLAPIGITGEIYIGGASVTRGYLKRGELTAEKYITIDGERFYRSGDLGRYLPDGNLAFVGRVDEQVKVRGYRIELGEIESVLKSHSSVRDVVVLVREDVPGNQRLVAFVVPAEPEEVVIDKLRTFLRDKLPEYMVPAAFVVLEEIPLTSNGKVDRNKLLSLKATPSGEAFVEPRTPSEATLADIWRQVLSLAQVGVNDNFFELGGDSILSIQIVAKANRAGLRLRPKDIFMYQTIAELATVVGTFEAPVVEQGEVMGRVPLTPIQRAFFESEMPEPHHFNQAVLLEVEPELDAAAWKTLIKELLAHHDALRLRFNYTDGAWEQSHASVGGNTPFTWIDLSTLAEEDQPTAIESKSAELQASLNLTDGPMVPVALFDLGKGKPQRLLIAVHHLLVDGVSWRILLEDLQTGYQHLKSGEDVVLPPKTTSFKLWSEKLAEYARSDEVAREEAYWSSESRRNVPSLPMDYTGGSNTVASALTVGCALEAEETIALLQRVPPVYRTQINDALLTALGQALSGWLGDDRVLIDIEGHGREELFDDVDLSRTVGWFTVRYPVLLDLSETATPGDALKTVKEQLREVPHRGIGYGLLKYLGDKAISAKLRALPSAEVVFNYLGQLDQALPNSAVLRPASESFGPLRSALGTRDYALEIDASVVNGRLELAWTYSSNLHRRCAIERLAEDFLVCLRSIIAQCESDSAGSYTPSDFPLARLQQEELDRLVKAYPQLEDIYDLSPVQQGMLFHTLSNSERAAYTEQVCVELRGDLDVEIFEQAWQHVIAQHTSLRTSFAWRGLSRPLQIVHQRLEITVDCHDRQDLMPDEQQNRLQEFLNCDRERGLDLSEPPLMRLTLIRSSRDSYYFVWTHHHIVLDGWSLPLVVNEVLQHYGSVRAGRKPAKAARRPYRDYIRWLQQQDQSRAESYWRQTLKGFSEPLSLGANGHRVGFANHDEYGDEVFSLSTITTEALQAFTRQHLLTLNTLVQGTWALLLNFYSGRDDLVYGMTVSGRPAEIEDIESMVGLFINTIPVRVAIDHETSVVSWLREQQSRHSEMRQFEYCSLVQEWSEVPLGKPLFESLLVFENYPVEDSLGRKDGDLDVRAVKALVRTKYPITLVVTPAPVLSFYLAYDRRRFDPGAIRNLLSVMGQLLERILTEPTQLISQVLGGLVLAEEAGVLMSPAQPGTEVRSNLVVLPRNPIEEMLAEIWAEVLGADEVSVDDNFFNVGGHSLLATQIVSRLREAFNIEVPLNYVFESPTVASLARRVASAMNGGSGKPTPPLKRLPRDKPLPLSLAQEPLWVLDLAIPGTSLFNIPLAVRLTGQLNVSALERSLGEIIRRHEVLRTTFGAVDNDPVQVINADGYFTLPLVDLETVSEATREAEALRLAVEDARRPFDLTAGPLLRTKLLRLGEHDHWLVFTLHHIIADAWAAGVFVRELTALYNAFFQGHASPLRDLQFQYVDFAYWQRECLRIGVFDSQLEYWKRKLDGPLPRLSLPTDRPKPETSNFKTASLSFNVPEELLAALKGAGRRENVSLFMILVTAFQSLLFRYSGQEDMRVGTLIANRNRVETEDLFGLFVNTLVLRSDLAGDPTCREALQRVRGVVLEAFNNQDLPFEQLMQELERERGLDRTAIIEVLFILQNAPLKPLNLPGLRVSHLQEVSDLAESGVTLTMFDLILMMGEGPDGLSASLKYKTELFDDATIERLFRNFVYVLENIASQPDRRLSALELPH